MNQDNQIKLFTEIGCHPSIRGGGIILIPKNEVLQCSEKLLDDKIKILGFDGFILYQKNKIQPSLENSIDFESKQPTVEAIKLFLQTVSENITHLEIVIDY